LDSDRLLVEQVIEGNIDSFNIIINKYENIIFKFIYNMIRDREAAEDITQETFITVYDKLYLYKKEFKFINWVYQIAKNKTIDYVRKYRKVYEVNIEDTNEIISNEISPDDYTIYNDTKEKIEKFISSLEETDRQIIVLKYSQDLTFLDVSRIMNLSESTVKRKFYRLREEFAEMNKEKERCN
jgi:RNA polymerase sigma-70 factor, ECF subfamily